MKICLGFIGCVFFVAVFATAISLHPVDAVPQQNHRPSVRIIYPVNFSLVNIDSLVHYMIAVSDAEDGESKFDEISPKEVLLEVRFVGERKMLKVALNKALQPDASGLALMRKSNCFNCHDFENRTSGPSLQEIGQKYSSIRDGTEQLGKSIENGSVNVWGSAPMPSHPEFDRAQVRDMATWIESASARKDLNYYLGLQGTISWLRTKDKKGFLVLSASYIDHGVKNEGQRLEGHDAIVLQLK